MRLAAICAIYGGFDLIPPVPEGVDDAVLITDVPVHSGWRNIVEPSGAHPRLAAKRPKVRPDLYTNCEASLWMDGSVHVLDDRFVRLVRERLKQHELILWDHPEDRDCLLQEARHCHDWLKYRDEPLLEQAEHYIANGMPENFGLWAATCIARRHTPLVQRVGDAWLEEIERWTIQDQVSLPYVLWTEGLRPGTFGIDQLENDMVVWVPHAQEIYNHRGTVLGLEAEIIRLGGIVDWYRGEVGKLEARVEALQGRRAVRLSNAVARRLRRLGRLLRS